MPIIANSCASSDRVERCIRRLFYVPTYEVQLHTPPPTYYTSISLVINRYLGVYRDDNLYVIYY